MNNNLIKNNSATVTVTNYNDGKLKKISMYTHTCTHKNLIPGSLNFVTLVSLSFFYTVICVCMCVHVSINVFNLNYAVIFSRKIK